ncbi:hypothetical protein LJC32_06580, partial [Oscillospiraceae bacterium OttesenSCG-928-F05]|nr:hypothetical protein [Oscillospiraceae bacterium OttesenSCG-928-F05]
MWTYVGSVWLCLAYIWGFIFLAGVIVFFVRYLKATGSTRPEKPISPEDAPPEGGMAASENTGGETISCAAPPGDAAAEDKTFESVAAEVAEAVFPEAISPENGTAGEDIPENAGTELPGTEAALPEMPVAKKPKRRWRFRLKSHPLCRADAVAALIITAVYSVAAFTNLGDMQAPESFFRFTRARESVVIDLGSLYDIERMAHYTGSYHADSGYTLEASSDGESFYALDDLKQNYAETFRWIFSSEDWTPLSGVRYLRLTAQKTPMELGELVL